VLCAENIGIAAAGYGGDADFALMSVGNCFHLPPALSYVEGAFIGCTGATAYSALRKLSPSGRDRLVVFGLGPVGLSAVVVGRALGATVYGVDLIAERMGLAMELGAAVVVNAAQTDPVEAIRSLTDGRGVEMALETSGSQAGQSDAVDVVRPHGRIAFVGLSKGEKSISAEQFIHKQAVLFGSKVMPAGMYEEMTRFMIARGVRFDPIVTHRISLDDGPAAFARFDAGAAGKFVFDL
jgi:propanol-preferring alcohol dehydrogenase